MSNPLFLTDVAAMQQELKLRGIPATGDDALVVLADAILQARLHFYRRLGITRVGQIVAFTEEYDDPTTNDELLRALAKTVEVKLTWCFLSDRLPQNWMDDSGGAWQQYNEQGTFRKMSLRERNEQRERFMLEIEEAMAVLEGDVALGDSGEPRVTTFSPECPPRLLDSIQPIEPQSDTI